MVLNDFLFLISPHVGSNPLSHHEDASKARAIADRLLVLVIVIT